MASLGGPYRRPANSKEVHALQSQELVVPDGLRVVSLDKPTTPFQTWEGLEYCNLYDATDGVIGWCRHHKNFDHHTHYHHASEVIYVTDGEAQTFHDGDWVSVRKGDTIVADSRQQHRTRTSGAHMDCLYFFPDGPQVTREYWYLDDVDDEKIEEKEQNGRPFPVPDAGSPYITPAPPAAAGWQQLVDDKTWSVARLQLEPGSSHTNQSHRFCFVLNGDVRVKPLNTDCDVVVKSGDLAFGDAESAQYSMEVAGDKPCTVLMFCMKRTLANQQLVAKL